MNDLVSRANKLGLEVTNIFESLTDKTIPLAERWEAFLAINENGNIQSINTFTSHGFMRPILGEGYGEFFECDRHTVHSYIEAFEHVVEHVMESGEFDDMSEEEVKELYKSGGITYGGIELTHENVAEWREKVLAGGYTHFTNDW